MNTGTKRASYQRSGQVCRTRAAATVALALACVVGTFALATPVAFAQTVVSMAQARSLEAHETLFAVPVTITSPAAFSGADLGFRCGPGLSIASVSFNPPVPASTIALDARGTTWCGFFSLGANALPTPLSATLYCTYAGTGAGTTTLTLAQMSVYTVDGQALVTETLAPNLLLTVTRAAASNPGENGNTGDNGNNNGTTGGQTDPDVDKTQGAQNQQNALKAPAKVRIVKLTAAKKKLTLTWKKVTGVSKYQIRYRVKGTKSWKTKTVSAAKSKLTLTRLKKGKRYQVQIRGYKQSKNIVAYGVWSATKTSKKVK